MRIASIIEITAASVLTFGLLWSTTTRAEEVPAQYQPAVAKGLEWLVRNQHRDGHWEANGGSLSIVVTALSGMALLMEGSTLCEGKYCGNIRRAADWLMQYSQPNGLIGDPNGGNGSKGENGGYMYGHGFSMLFLSSIVGEEGNAEQRCKLIDILERAAKFSRLAQCNCGGWTYCSAKDAKDRRNGLDEGSVTVTQLQGLRAARNAGISVPAETIRDGIRYLHDTTTAMGGVRYSLTVDDRADFGRPVLTAAAIVCGFSTGEYNSPHVKKWFKYCRYHLPNCSGNGRRMGHDEYTCYYYAQAVYMLGDDGWAKLFPTDGEKGLTWSAFRKELYETLLQSQHADGSWTDAGAIGSVYTTALNLSVLQLDKAVLPIYQR